MLETLSGITRLYGLVGHPISQVMSPAGVTRAFESRGRNAVLVPIQRALRRFRRARTLINLRGLQDAKHHHRLHIDS